MLQAPYPLEQLKCFDSLIFQQTLILSHQTTSENMAGESGLAGQAIFSQKWLSEHFFLLNFPGGACPPTPWNRPVAGAGKLSKFKKYPTAIYENGIQ